MRSPVRGSRRPLRLVALATLAGMTALGVAGWQPTASAGSAGAVSFTGGCGVLGSGLGAASEPDRSEVSLRAGDDVDFVNRLGQAATLHVDGEAAAEVAAGGSVGVTFHEGPVTITMQIDCLLGKPSGAVTVRVSGGGSAGAGAVSPPPQPVTADPGTPAPRRPDPAKSERPSPGGGGSSSGPSGGSGDADGQSGARTSAAGPPAAWPAPGGPAPAGPGAGAPATGGPTDGGPATGWWPGGSAEPATGSDPDSEPEPDEGEDAAEAGDELGSRWGDQADGGGQPTGPATVEVTPSGETLIAEPLARTSGGGPTGMLALIATVCVVGVSAGAWRAILTQRANRSEWA